MQSFYFLKFINDELKQTIEDLTKNTNIIIHDIHITDYETKIKYEILSEEGFLQKELFLFNEVKK